MALPSDHIYEPDLLALLGISKPANLGAACIAENINKWSKHKPVRDPGVGVNWPAGLTGYYGHSIPLWNNATKTFTPTNWEYLKPRGTVSPDEPKRPNDFRGYEHDDSLTWPMVYCKTSDQEENAVLSPAQPSGGTSSGSAKAKMFTGSSAVRNNLSDMGFGDYYFGILVHTPDNHWYIRTNPATLSTGDESTGLGFTYQADVVDRTDPDAHYTNFPYGVGNYTLYYVMSATDYSSDWTLNPTGVIYLLPSGSVTGLTFKNSFTLEVEDWIWAATGSMSWTYDKDSYAGYQESIIYTSRDDAFTVSVDEASFLEYMVYAADGTTNITNSPSQWGNGCRLRLFPANANGGAAQTGTVRINATNCTGYPISVTHQAAPATVNVYAGNVDVLTVSATSGNVLGGLNIAFTPHYIPGGDPTYDVCWFIKVNDVEQYSSGTTGIACTNDTPKGSTSIEYGSATWEDGDRIDIFLYYEEAPGLS